MTLTSPRTTRAPLARVAYDRAERAVIDIGSNTVRLVIYSGPQRTPVVWLNEKVTARLGRDLAESGRIPDKAANLALRALARFASIVEDIEVPELHVVATAAAREALNGPEFIERVRALGLPVQVLSGEEEAITAAYGVIGAFPGAQGVVADLGGGSLELVAIADGGCSHGESLPLGTLRLPALRAEGPAAFEQAVSGELQRAGWAAEHPGPLYMVGGTWRAMATFAMHERGYPLTDPQAFALSVEEADQIARQLMEIPREQLSKISGISSSRAAGLADAAALLGPVLEKLQPEGVVFSSWGLREGLMFRQLDAVERAQDPLLASVTRFVEPRGATVQQATQIAAWTTAVNGTGGLAPGESARLRLAATLLAMTAARIEPNLRLPHSMDWALHKRWLGIDHRGRALLAAALAAACGKPEPMPALYALADEASLREAAAWGLAIRLCRRFGAGSRVSLLSSKLVREEDTLVLWVEPDRRQLVSDSVRSDLKALANWLGLAWRVDSTAV